MGCACSKACSPEDDGAPNILYSNLPAREEHSHLAAHVDLRKLSKLVRRGRLAPLYPHDISEQACGLPEAPEECPICTVAFPSLNVASCCAAHICTECFVYHQTASDPPGRAQCPFCKSTPFAVRYLGRQQSREQQQLDRKADDRLWLHTKQGLRRQQLRVRADSGAASTSAGGSMSDAVRGADADEPLTRQQQGGRIVPSGSWLERLAAADGSIGGSGRRVQLIRVLAGFSHDGRSSSSSGGGGPPDVAPHSDTSPALPAAADGGGAPAGADESAVLATAAAAAGAAAGGDAPTHYPLQLLDIDLEQQQQQQHDGIEDFSYALGHYEHQQHTHIQLQQEQQQQQQVEVLRLQQVDELSQLAQRGLLPQYAAAELAGLQLEELDEILLEQALMASLSQGAAAAGRHHTPTTVAVQ